MGTIKVANIYNQDCTKCALSKSRTKIVWNRGELGSKIVLVGEGPGEAEDRMGKPFVGRSGALLDKALYAAFGTNLEEQVYITNMVKCRPPGNRNPTDIEVQACVPYLQAEFELLNPTLVVALGKVAAERLLGHPVKITKRHGQLDFTEDGRSVLICYHPAYVLRNRGTVIEKNFFRAFVEARRIAYGPDTALKLPTGSVRRAHTPSGEF